MKNPPTLPANRSGSPERGIDRLFAELLAMYGKHWLDLWADTNIVDVKASWAAALHGIDAEGIHLALQSLRTEGKPFPPTQPEFVSLCRQFVRRGPHRLALTAPRYEPPGDVFKNLRKQFDAKGRE